MPKLHYRLILPWILALLALVPISCTSLDRNGPADADYRADAAWPHDASDLAPDPALIFGTLPNGFRYVLMKNATPRDRVSMHLMVEAGSVHETDAQQGLAHFLEHMVFNGSTHFPPGEMVKYFQRIGMEFGPDANASTGFFKTVYDILLPDGTQKSISEGLVVLGDYAEGALLLEDEVDRERKVILAEMRTRDTAAYRTFVEALKFELPNDRISRRLPIGLTETLLAADQARLREFYDTWYRPERMILVMVGDFDPDAARPMIQEAFGGMTPRAPARPVPEMGEVDHQGIRPFYHHEQESGNTDVTLQVIRNIPPTPDSFEKERRELILDIANQVVQNRLDREMRQPDAPFTRASAASDIYPPHVEYTYITAQTRPEDWEKALAALDRTLRQALEYPFTDGELDRVKKDYLAALDKAVKNAPTRQSKALARRIMGSLEMGRVFQSPAQRKQLYAPVIQGLEAAEAHQVFRDAWSPDHRLVMVSGNARIPNARIPDDPEAAILAAYERSIQTAVSAPEAARAAAFPYLDPPEGDARIVRREEIADLGIVQVDFANGVRLNLKPTDFKANEVVAALSFGEGRSSEPADKPGLARLSEEVLNESGLGAMDRDTLDQALAGKNTAVRFDVSGESFSFQAKSVTDEMALLFQLLHARLVDPGFREAAFSLSMSRLRQTYEELSRTIEGAMPLSGSRFLAGGDSRFGFPPYDDLSRLTLGDVSAWMKPVLDSAPLELSVVGDFDVDTTVTLAATYFGSLPRRTAAPDSGRSDQIAFPRGKTLEVPVQTRTDKGVVQVSYPTDDIWDIGKTRRLSVLSSVLQDRMREIIREELGASYSQDAYNSASRAYPGYGVMSAVIRVSPDDAESVIREVKRIARGIVQGGITADELERALDPTLTSIKDMQQQNRYWLNTVLAGSREHPEQLDWSRTIARDYGSITKAELQRLARQYLDNDAAAVIIIRPAIGVADRPAAHPAG